MRIPETIAPLFELVSNTNMSLAQHHEVSFHTRRNRTLVLVL